MNITIAIICLLFYLHLGWIWADVIFRIEPQRPGFIWRGYLFALLLWPVSMTLWDAEQQDKDDGIYRDNRGANG